MRLLALFLALLLPAAASAAARIEHVVIVTVDGLRPDAIAAAPAPAIQGLAARGRATLAARAVEQPVTLPSHMTMVTGLPTSQHGIRWNDAREAHYDRPTIFTRAQQAGLRTALFYGKPKLALLAPEADERFGPPDADTMDPYDPAGVSARFSLAFGAAPAGLSFVHLRQPDLAGHRYGWMSAEYLAAVRESDAALAVVLDAIAKSPVSASTAILLTTDHGGEGTTHGADKGETSWVIPFICAAPGLKPGTLEPSPTLAAVGPTAIAWLRLRALPDAAPAARGCLP